MAGLLVEQASKSFGAGLVVDHVDLRVEPGSFVALLGPSGCGKTTLLRLVAGLERLTHGRIQIGERMVAGPGQFVEPEDRGLGMVFQSYALWPHMTVWRNVEFGLKARRRPQAERRRRVTEALETVGLMEFAFRRPAQLSGGQRQRVALARCLALDPPLILLDEPLANLDPRLRQGMQREFRRLHRESGTTFLYVTHDHAEALALADCVAVMERGRLQQVASPQTLYRRPANSMVAAFLGGAALVPVEVLAVEQELCRLTLAGRHLTLPGAASAGSALLCLRAEDVRLVEGDSDESAAVAGRVIESLYCGRAFTVDVALDAETGPIVQVSSARALEPGLPVRLAVRSGWVLPRRPEARA